MPTSNTLADALTAGIVPVYGRQLVNPTANTFFGQQPVAQVGGSNVPFEPIAINLSNPVNLRQPRLNVRNYNNLPLSVDGSPFLVRASGLVQPSRSDSQLTISLWQGNPSGTTVSNVYSNSPQTMPATISNWNLKFEMLWSSGSEIIDGLVSGNIGTTSISQTYFSVPNVTSVVLTLSAVLSTSNAVPSTVSLNAFFADFI